MLFKLFKKNDSSYYRDRGDRFFTEERYAEARHEYEEALNRLSGDNGASGELRSYVTDRLGLTGIHLAQRNIEEAGYAIQRGDSEKAIDHIDLALELSNDVDIRKKADELRQQAQNTELPQNEKLSSKSCTSCQTSEQLSYANIDESTDFLSIKERFELLIQPLPGNLTERYRQMGEEFACAYIAINDGRVDEGLKIFKELVLSQEIDILYYEIALISFQQGKSDECETLLRKALELNADNPLSLLSMVQLFLETERYQEAVTMLEGMIADNHIPDQALIYLGDILVMLGEVEAGFERYNQALALPSVARVAAEKAIPVLEAMGRNAEATAIAKRYLKGCC